MTPPAAQSADWATDKREEAVGAACRQPVLRIASRRWIHWPALSRRRVRLPHLDRWCRAGSRIAVLCDPDGQDDARRPTHRATLRRPTPSPPAPSPSRPTHTHVPTPPAHREGGCPSCSSTSPSRSTPPRSSSSTAPLFGCSSRAATVERASDPLGLVHLATQVAQRDSVAALTLDSVSQRGSGLDAATLTAAVDAAARLSGSRWPRSSSRTSWSRPRSGSRRTGSRRHVSVMPPGSRWPGRETAAPRSLANGAKLLDDHPTLSLTHPGVRRERT